MRKSYQAASWAINTSRDPSHGYSQANRWGPDYDCSSFVIQAYEQAGVPVKEAGATYTGNMKAAFLACGFKDVTRQVNLANGYGTILGDVLLNEQNHAAMALDNGQVVHARSSEGNSIPGDQSGNEICIQSYWDFPWDCVLRYEEKEEQNDMQGVDISNYQRGLTIQQLKDAGKEFAIIKLTEGSNLIDANAFEFYKEAYEMDFPVGCYCYSHAMNSVQAVAEAAFLLNTINKFLMPCGIYLDVEDENMLALPADQLKDIIDAWCFTISAAGYTPGAYGSEGNLWAKINPNRMPADSIVWIAKWSNSSPNLPCDLWQNSENGRIDGYAGPVDTDITRGDKIPRLAAKGYNKPEPVVEEEIEPEPKVEASTNSKISAIIMLQTAMYSTGYWGIPDGNITPEFKKALKKFVKEVCK